MKIRLSILGFEVLMGVLGYISFMAGFNEGIIGAITGAVAVVSKLVESEEKSEESE